MTEHHNNTDNSNEAPADSEQVAGEASPPVNSATDGAAAHESSIEAIAPENEQMLPETLPAPDLDGVSGPKQSIANEADLLSSPAEPPVAPPDAPVSEPETWEDDENSTTFFLRALFTFVAGAFLSWAQSRAVIGPGSQWGRWVGLSIVANFLLPVGIVWMFFAQGLSHLDWLRDQHSNAWNYGWNFRNWRRHLKLAGIMFAGMLILMLPFLFFTPAGSQARYYYRTYYLPPVTDAPSLIWLLTTLTLYMLCWEWFHRGFLLFGMAQGFGPISAIVLQAAIFASSHISKPREEFISSFIGGLILGTIAWREKSFAPAFYTHALVHIVWVILVLF